MSAASSIESCFSSLNADLEADHEKRELIQKEVRQINELQRKIQFQLQKVHTNPANAQSVVEICKSANPLFAQIWPHWQNISAAIGKEHVEKFHHLWRFAMSQLVFMATLKHVLETHSLMSQDDTAALVVGKAEAKQESKAQARIEIDLEDYLSGLSSLPRELSRLCVNCVRSGNYTLPVAISAFVSDLYSGFRLLNLRNDTLRRKIRCHKIRRHSPRGGYVRRQRAQVGRAVRWPCRNWRRKRGSSGGESATRSRFGNARGRRALTSSCSL